ncbi:MAG TPA: class I adenylate-forming enzyme family protein, partial [Candidatus Deferrimicrobiaceae bacterium]|nr:class I adenylate-forming enzyme family protein [Candidatus Deferrimicrobiaceae bacterium]
MNIAGNFLRTAERIPDKPFLVDSTGASFSYSQVLGRARRFATVLASRGAGPGDRVILTFPNSVDYLCAYLGALFLDCTLLIVDYRSRPAHLEYVRDNCRVFLWAAPAERPEYRRIPGFVLFPADLERHAEMAMERLCPGKNPQALIMYTSGATGIPKGVCLSHANLQHTIRSITQWAQIDGNDRELTTLSLSHLFGLAHIHIYWTLGGTVFIEEKLQDVPRILERISRERITSFPGTPGGFKMILDRFPEQFARHARGLKYIIVNSAPMAREYIGKILDLLPDTRFYMYYGLTEASRSSYICYNDHRDKLESVGRPTPGSEICVGSPSSPLVGEPGEILVRGPQLTSGYWGMDTAPFFADGWFRTGDLGIVDSDGFLTWKGRLKEQINIDGLKLTPMEVETVLAQHANVMDCAVVGAPDELTGEAVVAFVVPRGEPSKALEIDIRRF